MFEVNGLRSGYRGVEVLQDLDLAFDREVFAVLGANGAGKSTLLRTMAGLLAVTAGSMTLDGEEVTGRTPFQLAAMGLSYVPQENNVFPGLTVTENLSLGSLLNASRKATVLAEVFDLFPHLSARASQRAGTLSGGERQMVAIGRALMQEPTYLLLDEPTAGLAPLYVDNLFRRILEIHKEKKVGVVLAEQNVAKTLAISDQVVVLRLGAVAASGSADEVSNEQIKKGYGI